MLAPGIALLAAAWTAQAAEAPDTAGSAASTGSGYWDFEVQLDDKPIGKHRFRVTAEGEARTVQSDADFTVKLLGITAYRYRHHATEHWRGNCLADLQAETDDDGEKLTTRAQPHGGALSVSTGTSQETLPGCVMSFAYWNPALRAQTRLLNAQTGKFETVQVSAAGTGPIAVRGSNVQATRWRITGTEHPIDVWYAADGRWIGLDATVSGGRRLRYRLE